MKKVISILLTAALILSCVSMTAFAADESQKKIITAAFPDFTNQISNRNLKLEGLSDCRPNPYAPYDVRAKIIDGKINLTPKKWDPGITTAFLDKKITTDNAAFSTYFTFMEKFPTDGFSFVIGNSGTSAPSNWTQGGMSMDNETFYVFFDTYNNYDPYGDPSDNFVQVCSSKTDGNWTKHAEKNLNSDEYLDDEGNRKMVIADGQLKHCWIDYNGSDMNITLSNTANRSEGVDIEFNFGSNIIGDLLGEELYFGFTTITFNAEGQEISIGSWYLDNSCSPIDLSQNTYDAAASISMQAVTSDNQTATVSILAEDYLGQPAENIELSLTSTAGKLSASTVTTDANGSAIVTLTGENLSGTVVNALSESGIASSVVLDATPITAAFDDFSDETRNQTLVLEGLSDCRPGDYGKHDVRTKIIDGKINLTPKTWSPEISTAFLDKKVNAENAAFSTYFTFMEKFPTDGFSFVIGNSGTSAPSDWTQGGMSMDNETFYVFFDTYENKEGQNNDPSNNFVQVCSSIKNSGGWNKYAEMDLNSGDYLDEDRNPKMVIADGQLKHCWIDYDGSHMYITLSNTANRTEGVDIEFNFGSNIIGDHLGEELYFGFSTITYNADGQEISISSWYLDNKFNPIDNTVNYSFAPMSVNVAASAESVTEANVQVTAYDYAGNLYPGAEVTLYSANDRFEPVTVTTGLNGKATATVSGKVVYMDTISAVANGGAVSTAAVAYTQPDVTVEFESETFTSENGSLNYRIYVPDEYDGTQSYPVLLFLHGMGERGDDNTKHIANNSGILKRLVGMEADDYKCIIVAPQCPETDVWCAPADNENYNVETQETTNANTLAYELLQSVITEYNADTDRIYGAGISMGCFGIMDMAMKHQRLFAAIAAVCGATDVNAAYRLYGTSIWFFHGDNDQSVIYYNSRDAYAAYNAAGLDVKFNLYAGVNHDSWNNAFAETELLEWMFSKELPELTKGDVTGDGSINVMDFIRLKKGIASAENAVIYGNADFDESGALDSGDLVTVKQLILAN